MLVNVIELVVCDNGCLVRKKTGLMQSRNFRDVCRLYLLASE